MLYKFLNIILNFVKMLRTSELVRIFQNKQILTLCGYSQTLDFEKLSGSNAFLDLSSLESFIAFWLCWFFILSSQMFFCPYSKSSIKPPTSDLLFANQRIPFP